MTQPECICSANKGCPRHPLSPYVPLQTTVIKWEDGKATNISVETYTPTPAEYELPEDTSSLSYDEDY